MIDPMALSVQKFREVVFQLLYTHSFEKSDIDAIIPLLMRQNAIPKKAAKEASDKVLAIWKCREELDQLIKKVSIDFELDRIGLVEKALLRQGLYDLHYTDLPPKVMISEAVRLAKKFASVESSSFVNALLDAVYKEREDATVSTEQVSP